MQKKFKPLLIIGLLMLFIPALAACGKSAADKVTKVSVGIPNDGYPFGYVKHGKADGYDVAVVKALDKKLKQYSFTYQSSDFPTSLSNLDSGKTKMAADEYEKNAQRQKKFTYGSVGYAVWDTYIVTTPKTGPINSFADLKGKKVVAEISTNQAAAAQKYLKAHPKAFKISYVNYTNEQFVQALTSKQVDATLAPKYQVDGWNRTLHSNLVIGKKPVNHSNAYLLFNKSTDKQFVKAANKGMSELNKNGTLQKLSQKYLKGDYVPK